VLLVNLGIMFAGSLALASMNTGLFWPFVICFGLGWGGIYTLLQLLTMDAFGLKAAGRVLGTRTVLDAIGGGLGPWVTGWLFDRTGSYQVPFLVVSALILVTFFSSMALRMSQAAADAPAAGRA
jgi:MFS family permease